MTSIDPTGARDERATAKLTTEQLLDRYCRRRTRSLRDAVIDRHHEDVVAIAKALSLKLPKSVEIDDLVHAGICGLMHSIERFRADRGVPFKAFMRRRVRGAMLDELRNLDTMPRLLRRQQREWDDVTSWMRQSLRREPTELELQQAIELHRVHGVEGEQLGEAVEQELRLLLTQESNGVARPSTPMEARRRATLGIDGRSTDDTGSDSAPLDPAATERPLDRVDAEPQIRSEQGSLNDPALQSREARLDSLDIAANGGVQRLAKLLGSDDPSALGKPRFDSEWLDSVADETDGPAESMDRRDLIESIRGSLKPVEWTVLEMHYLRGLSGKEIAERLDLSASRICQIHVRVLERLKQRMRDRSRS